jgi:integrase/recombinase XerC
LNIFKKEHKETFGIQNKKGGYPMLQKHITEFFSYCKVVGLSTKSINSLNSSLREFRTFIETQTVKKTSDITYAMLVDFVADFREPSIHKKKARVWCMHQFFSFLTLSRVVRKNIASDLEYPKIEKTVPHYLTATEYNRILAYFALEADSTLGLRNLVIVLMLGILGLRTTTIIGLNVEHINIEAGLVLIHEKGNKRRHMVLPALLVQTLEHYLNRCDHASGPLFLSVRQKRISPRTLQDIFHKAMRDLGIDQSLHPRLFRHTAATLLNKTAGTSITQAVLGHARRANTLRYTHLNPDQYAQYMRRHPFMQEGLS